MLEGGLSATDEIKAADGSADVPPEGSDLHHKNVMALLEDHWANPEDNATARADGKVRQNGKLTEPEKGKLGIDPDDDFEENDQADALFFTHACNILLMLNAAEQAAREEAARQEQPRQ